MNGPNPPVAGHSRYDAPEPVAHVTRPVRSARMIPYTPIRHR